MNLVVLDFETFFDSKEKYTLKKMTTDAYIHDPRFHAHGVGIRFPDGDRQWIRDRDIPYAFRQIPWDKSMVVCHNSAFDGAILSTHYDVRPRMHIDTLSMARVALGPVDASLDDLAARYQLPLKMSERLMDVDGVRILDDAQSQALGEYCLHDVHLTYEILQRLKKGFRMDELRFIDLTVRMFTEPKLILDKEMLDAYSRELAVRRDRLLQRLGLELGDIRSDAKFADALRNLNVEPPTKLSPKRVDERGLPQTVYAFAKTDDGFKELLDGEDEEVTLLCEARVELKSTINESRTTRMLKIANEERPWPIMLRVSGAHTHRYSGGDKMNPQNLRKNSPMRDSIMAPPGKVILAGDSSQIEARFTAYVAGQKDLVEAFRNKEDIYSDFASLAYGRPINRKHFEIVNGEKVYPMEGEGFVGKTCILGLGFGMGGPKLQGTLKRGLGGISVVVPVEQTNEWVGIYRGRYHMIPKLWGTMENVLFQIAAGEEWDYGLFQVSGRGIHLPNGTLIQYPRLSRKRNEKGRWQWTYFNRGKPTSIWGGKATENLIQAMAFCLIKEQMLRIHDEELPIVLQVHDEIVTLADEDRAEESKQLMEQIMSTPPAWAPDLPVACEVGFAKRYGQC